MIVKGGLGLIVFSVAIAIAVYRYINTPATQRTELAKKYFFRFSIGLLALFLGVVLIDVVDKLIAVILILLGFYLALFSGMDLTTESQKIKKPVNSLADEINFHKEAAQVYKKTVEKNNELVHKKVGTESYVGNIRCRECGCIDKVSSFLVSSMGGGFRKCHRCGKDFQYLSRYVSEKTYIGNYRCNSCNQQDEESHFLPSSAGGDYRQCHMCGSHFQVK